MGIGKFLGIGKEIAEPVDAIGGALDKLFTSDEERLSYAEIMEKLRQQPAERQHALNLLNAGSNSVFIAGWRPMIGWICAVALATYYIPQFVLATYMWVKFCLVNNAIQDYPIESGELMELVFGMLGFAILRTAEKYKGVAR